MSDLTDYQGPRGLNFFDEDKLLQEVLTGMLPARGRAEIFKRLSAFGAVCGGKLGALIEAAHRPEKLPKLKRFDAVGNKIESIDYCLEQKEARRILAEAFYTDALDHTTRMTLAYLANQNGEGGITCPLAMTEGLIELLEERGTPEQAAKCVPIIKSVDPETALPAGQFVTERQGGSRVGENETRARKLPDGAWALTGLKWFCSNPGEIWAATAKIEDTDTVGLFLVHRRKADGTINNHSLLRAKEICGTKGKATAEIEFEGTRAELIGRARNGMAYLVRLLGVSRLHVGVSALGIIRRAVMEAELFSEHRMIGGRPSSHIPSTARALKRLRALHAQCLLAFYACLESLRNNDADAEILVPLLKIEISKRATIAVREAQILIGGHGILEDFSILPRLANDAIINEIWEGIHAVLAEHATKALRRNRACASFLLRAEGAPREKLDELKRRVEDNRGYGEDERSLDNEPLCALAFDALADGLLSRHAGLARLEKAVQ